MANDITANPWYLDTVMATPYFNGVRIGNLVWNDAVTVGDILLIKDRNGKIIVSAKCNQANYPMSFGGFGWVEGFQLITLGSGNISVVISKA